MGMQINKGIHVCVKPFYGLTAVITLALPDGLEPPEHFLRHILDPGFLLGCLTTMEVLRLYDIRW
jgi:hypothetical protein